MLVFLLRKQYVYFFQAQPLGLLHTKIDEGDGQHVEHTEQKVELPTDGRYAHWAKFDNLMPVNAINYAISPLAAENLQ